MENDRVKRSLRLILCVAAIAFPVLWGAAVGAEEKKAEGPSWQDGMKLLQEGNARFVSGKRTFPDQGADRRRDLGANGQHPFAVILTCSDSRVAAEHLFDAGLGDIFVIRVAGNVADTDEIATVEYGTEHLKAPLVVVLGHSKCGAVTAVVKGDKVGGNLPALVDNIVPAVEKAKAAKGRTFSNELLAAAIEDNVWQSMEDLIVKSPIVPELIAENEAHLVGAVYDIDDGTIRWLGEHPQQAELLIAAEEKASAAGKSSAAAKNTGRSIFLSTLVCAGLMALLAAAYLIFFARRTRVKLLPAHKRLAAAALTVSLVFVALLALAVAEFRFFSGTDAVLFVVFAALSAATAILFFLAVIRTTNKAFKEYIGFVRSGGR
jgi:carbonic anhydrase